MSFDVKAQTGGATSPLVALAIIALFAVDYLAVRTATGHWQTNVLKLAVRDPSIIPIQITMAAGFVIALFAPRFAPALDLRGPAGIPATIGMILVAVGIALRAWAILTLGASFSRAVRVEPDQPDVSRTRREATLCFATWATSGRAVTIRRNAGSARLAIPRPQCARSIQ